MGAKSLIRKIMRMGYFWPMMQQDAAKFVKKCDSCQRYGNVQRVPGEKMMTISSPGRSHNEESTLWVLCHKERDKRNSCSLQLTTSPNGWKGKLLQQSQKQRYKILYGKTLFAGSGFQGRSFQTTVVSLTVRHSGHFART